VGRVHPKYPKIFSPVQLGPIEIPNRYYFSPHGLPLTYGTGPSTDLLAYTSERVKDGGCGLVILSCTVHDRGRHYQPCPYPAASIPAFRALADEVHGAGGKIFGQLWYWWGANGHWQPMSPPAPMLGPSVSQYGYRGVTSATHAVSKEEIRLLCECFRQSVTNLRAAGFDGVEIHSSHGGIIQQFLSPYFNRRTDEYGGSLGNRMRLLVETLEISRASAGEQMAVGMRFNCDEMLPGGYGTEEAYEILKHVCDAGLIDFADLDVAVEPSQLKYGMPSVFVEEHFYRPYVQKVRAAAGKVPVLSVLGRVTRMSDAEAVVASGLCDMVGSTRELLAEPQFVQLAREGKEELGRTCIACNWCLAGMGEGAFGCSINPASYRERLWGAHSYTRAARKANVVVVGSGPGGLEAARVAALKGHHVTLLEGREQLGGALALWAKLAAFEFYGRAIDWWQRELARLGVIVRTGTFASVQSVIALKPDAVIVATGANFCRDGRSGFIDQKIPGADRSHVITPEDVLEHGRRPQGRVVLLDGEGMHASSGIAELLAAAGAEVIMLSPNFAPFSMRVNDSLESDFVAERLANAKVSFRAATWVREIRAREVVAYAVYGEREETIDNVDAVVLATGRQCVNKLAVELSGKVAQLFTVGDALCVRPWATAAYEGHKFARLIGEPDAPSTDGEAYFRAEGPEVYPTPAS
jgi:2,4-dienoyl-CoA reductase-like NADH-dependent reductase (Old Yellow Enzyme family)/thioredoxin reductase